MKAFTLIELVLYLALLSVLMLASVSLAYGVADRAEGDVALLESVEAGNFALQKIRWAIATADSISEPSEGTVGSTLSIRTTDESLDPIVVSHDDGAEALRMREGAEGFSVIAGEAENVTFSREEGVLTVRLLIGGREYQATYLLP